MSPVSMADWRQRFKQRDDEMRAALDHQANLDAALKRLSNLADSSASVSSAILRAVLKQAQSSAAGLDGHLRNTGRPSLYAERCPDGARELAQRVFDVPELLELILSKLPVLELLKSYRVNRQWHSAIESSANLQRQLSLRPDTVDGYFQNVFQGRICGEVLPGFGTRSGFSTHRGLSSREETIPGNEILFKADFASSTDYYAMPGKCGTRIRKMYVCQPPIKEMNTYVECCRYNFNHHTDDHDRPSAVVRNEKGLTIGDLLDKTNEMLDLHKYCQNAEVFMLDDETGEVKNEVSFRGTVELKEDDPLLVEKRIKEEIRERELKDKKLRRQHIEQYRTAARVARDSRQTIPDLKDFISGLAGADDDSTS
ncbi:Putative F-box domain-containing protein [Septoria linicola]|uniref:F-box domain-containing protein n=1 Tax=Septoria linicola TaxID=215465 RepID=A0A9Q9AJ68_9PEZI|nr:putative F-box domain-containing protein [Septoria linicola]USW47425.1 Putative F-box domain-containing protein [Septoria linicola]